MYYNTLSSSEKYVVDCIINTFDFNKVCITMSALNWTYHDDKKSPNISHLKNTATNLLSECIVNFNKTREPQCIGTGGFTAELIDGANDKNWYDHLLIRFSVEDIDLGFSNFNIDIYNRCKKLDYINSVEYKKLLGD